MSVPAGARGENLSTVFSKSADMLAFVIRTAKNEKHIPSRYYNELAKPSIALAREAMHCIYGIDKTRDESLKAELLNKADIALTNLQAELHLLFLSFGLKPEKASEWYGKLEDLRITFQRWSNKISG